MSQSSIRNQRKTKWEAKPLLTYDCSICMTINTSELLQLPCGHNLCLSCLHMICAHSALTCPFCRCRISTWLRHNPDYSKLIIQREMEPILAMDVVIKKKRRGRPTKKSIIKSQPLKRRCQTMKTKATIGEDGHVTDDWLLAQQIHYEELEELIDLMNCNNNLDKCADVIQRLSSRIKNEQNHAMRIPSCIEKTFYQRQSSVGQDYCVEICGNGSISMNSPDSLNRDSYDMKQCFNSHQFTLSKMFDNKRKYIDYVVTNVLRQVVNHISFESLHRLSCCLPEQIEQTDIDSDRLVRILVTEILQLYGNNAGQVTDWYAFANSIQSSSSVLSPTTTNDENKVILKSKKSSTPKKTSDRILTGETKKIFDSTPIHKKQSSESAVFDDINTSVMDLNLSSTNQTPPAINTMTPMNTNTKETYTPIGAKSNQVFDSEKDTNNEFVPFNNKSKHSSLQEHQTLSDVHQHDSKSSKNSDRSLSSSSSDCILTIHHKHKHKKTHRHNRHNSTNFDISSLSHMSIPKNKHISLNASPNLLKDNNLNSITTEQSNLTDLLTREQILPTTQTENSSFQLLPKNEDTSSIHHDEQQESASISENNHQSSFTLSISSDKNSIQSNSKKKILQINHYPNMLADFD
ncbi:hypothetical protein I4U23_007563 [Adineta vaga]|nr:hypothetical protein I4U23_007563 [Adineta vaga]